MKPASRAKSVDLFALDADTPEQFKEELPDFLFAWQQEIDEAEPIFDIKGARLEQIARDLPHHQFFYARRAAEAKAVSRWLEILLGRTEARYLKNYHQSPRALQAREQQVYLQGEREIVEYKQLITDVDLKRKMFEEIVEALKTLGWRLADVTKLAVVEMRDIIL